MKTLENIKRENEVIVIITTTGNYNNYNLIMDEDIHNSDDIQQILEYTLHRMIDAGFTSKEIYSNSRMYIPTLEKLEELEEYNEFIHVDMDYILGGLITSIK